MTRTIGGVLDLRALAALSGGAEDYQRRANEHRPATADQIAAEVRRLAATGLRHLDIATALRVPLELVIETLTTPDHPKETTHD